MYATILQQRLCWWSRGKVMEYSVWFPQGSLNHPCHCPSQADHGRYSPQQRHIVFLDWRKAFDKVNRCGLLLAIRCIGGPQEMCKAVEGIYQDVRFVVNGCGAASAQHSSTSGIQPDQLISTRPHQVAPFR